MRWGCEKEFGRLGRVVLLNGNEVGKWVERMWCRGVDREKGFRGIVNKVIENVVSIMMLGSLKWRERG